jgi:hypothetical protein
MIPDIGLFNVAFLKITAIVVSFDPRLSRRLFSEFGCEEAVKEIDFLERTNDHCRVHDIVVYAGVECDMLYIFVNRGSGLNNERLNSRLGRRKQTKLNRQWLQKQKED